MKKILMASAATLALGGAATRTGKHHAGRDPWLYRFRWNRWHRAWRRAPKWRLPEVFRQRLCCSTAPPSRRSGGDSTCIDSSAANAAAERLDHLGLVSGGIVGADCSGVTHLDPHQRRHAQRHGHDLALAHLARAVDDRGQRPVLPHRTLRRTSGCRDGRYQSWERGHRHRRRDLHQQRLRPRPRPTASRRPSKPRAAP